MSSAACSISQKANRHIDERYIRSIFWPTSWISGPSSSAEAYPTEEWGVKARVQVSEAEIISLADSVSIFGSVGASWRVCARVVPGSLQRVRRLKCISSDCSCLQTIFTGCLQTILHKPQALESVRGTETNIAALCSSLVLLSTLRVLAELPSHCATSHVVTCSGMWRSDHRPANNTKLRCGSEGNEGNEGGGRPGVVSVAVGRRSLCSQDAASPAWAGPPSMKRF